MLAPPSSSDLLNSTVLTLCVTVSSLTILCADIDPTKMRKARQFSRSTAPPKKIDNTLWTETPAERQQRLADEVMGKRRRTENAEDDQSGENAAEVRKRRKREAELQRQVEDYTVYLLSMGCFACIRLRLRFRNNIVALRSWTHMSRPNLTTRKTLVMVRLVYGIISATWRLGVDLWTRGIGGSSLVMLKTCPPGSAQGLVAASFELPTQAVIVSSIALTACIRACISDIGLRHVHGFNNILGITELVSRCA